MILDKGNSNLTLVTDQSESPRSIQWDQSAAPLVPLSIESPSSYQHRRDMLNQMKEPVSRRISSCYSRPPLQAVNTIMNSPTNGAGTVDDSSPPSSLGSLVLEIQNQLEDEQLHKVEGCGELCSALNNVANLIVRDEPMALRRYRQRPAIKNQTDLVRRQLLECFQALNKIKRTRWRRQTRFRSQLIKQSLALNEAGSGLRLALVRLQKELEKELDSHDSVSQACESEIEFARSLALEADRAFFGHGEPQSYTKALDLYQKAAQSSYAPAMNILGTIYMEGLGVTKDRSKAIRYYSNASELGNIDAIYNLGKVHLEEGWAEEELNMVCLGIEMVEVAAQSGHQAGQVMMGQLHEIDDDLVSMSIERDLDTAQAWYDLAAHKDYVPALNHLGHLLYQRAQEQDIKPSVRQRRFQEAASWFQRAVDRGDAIAMNNLAICYESGQGVGQDLIIAQRLYQQAGLKGNANALENCGFLLLHQRQYGSARKMFRQVLDHRDENDPANERVHYAMGRIYELGLSVSKCLDTAREHYLQAGKQTDAKLRLAHLLLVDRQCTQDLAQAKQLLEELAEEKNVGEAAEKLGELSENGIGCDRDLDEALVWYQRAHELKSPNAAYHLGRMYEYGPQTNPELSLQLIQESAAAGHVEARIHLEHQRLEQKDRLTSHAWRQLRTYA